MLHTSDATALNGQAQKISASDYLKNEIEVIEPVSKPNETAGQPDITPLVNEKMEESKI